MASKETNISNRIRLALSGLAVTFRNNRGMFLTLDGKRKVKAGLSMAGSSDLIGWTPVTITPGMVGKTVAVFTAIEVKADSEPSQDQLKFIEKLRDDGGFGSICRSDQDAKAQIYGSVAALSDPDC